MHLVEFWHKRASEYLVLLTAACVWVTQRKREVFNNPGCTHFTRASVQTSCSPVIHRLNRKDTETFSAFWFSPCLFFLFLISCWWPSASDVFKRSLTQLRSCQTMKRHHWQRCRNSKRTVTAAAAVNPHLPHLHQSGCGKKLTSHQTHQSVALLPWGGEQEEGETDETGGKWVKSQGMEESKHYLSLGVN